MTIGRTLSTETVQLSCEIRNKADPAKHLFDLARALETEVPAVAALLYSVSGAIVGGEDDDLAEWVGFYVQKAIDQRAV